MKAHTNLAGRKYKAYTRKDIEHIPELQALPPHEIVAIKAVSAVLPFRVNRYVIEELIDWKNIPEDPIYQLTFPQRGMLDRKDLSRMMELVWKNATAKEIQNEARQIQSKLNPHPSGQMEFNVPQLGQEPLQGMQHKYRETVLFFPSQGQTCHAYCTYCFRWPQFVGIDELQFASKETEKLVDYLKQHREVTSVLLTGGDPLIMKTAVLRRYLEPLLSPELEHLTSIRLGTKATAYWPSRFLTDSDADELIQLFEEVQESGKHLAVMSHYSHTRELQTPAAEAATRRILATGATIRCQAPLIRNVNDDPNVWANLWRTQVKLGAIPYYMFVERNTGPKNYFEVPLAEAAEIFRVAYNQISGLARTVRGPSMSATPGKVVVDGVSEIYGQKVFVLKFIQGREPDWVGRPFFAQYDPEATWFNDLRPAFGQQRFFFEKVLRQIKNTGNVPGWNHRIPTQQSLRMYGDVER